VTRPVYALGVAALFRWGAAYLKEWVTYHRMVGVEHFWLYTDSDQHTWQPILADEVERGIVEVLDWPVPVAGEFIAGPLSRQGFLTKQMNAQKDALERARQRCEWLALIDVDEFLLPAEDDTVVGCLARHFPDASGVYINWRNFGTSHVWLAEGDPILFQLTACGVRDHPRNAVGKSIVRPDRVRIAEAWYPHHFILEPGHLYYNGDAQVLASTSIEPILDGRCHDRHIRINHYPMRDEHYFRAVRLRRGEGLARNQELEWEHYYAYAECRDVAIMDFIRDRHPVDYAAFWARHDPRTMAPPVGTRGGLAL